MAAASGSNPPSEKDLASSLQSHAEEISIESAVSILLIEDNAGDVTLIRESLREHGLKCQLVTIRDGEKAVQYVDNMEADAASGPSLIILDLNLPKVNGLEILKRLRESSKFQQVPVVVFSSSDDARDRQSVEQLGATRYVQKPSNLQEFMTIGRVIGAVIASKG
ncbi:MAG TPA: response regulator [Bryobacteraceae bacterium]|nr:response regulator [Bryobacteraceae bacterium]